MIGPAASRLCEHCGRPAIGASKCPHAIDPKYPCPWDEDRRKLRDRMRHIGN